MLSNDLGSDSWECSGSGMFQGQKSQSELVGVILLVGIVVTVILAASVFLVPQFLAGSDDVRIAIDAEATTQNVVIWHTDGNTVAAADIDIILRADDETRENLATNFVQQRGTDSTTFEAGDQWLRAGHGIAGDRMEILVVHVPTNQIVDRTTVDVTQTLGAAFSLNRTEPEVGDSIRFDGTESTSPEGNITNYSWTFEGADDAEGDAVVVRSFTTAGTYEVTLTVENEFGETATATRTIAVSPRELEASFTYDPDEPVVNETISFDASASHSPDGEIEEYRWFFGDGATNTTTDPVVEYRYETEGVYEVRLVVVDEFDNVDQEIQTVEVGDGEAFFDVTITGTNDPVVEGETLEVNFIVENTGDVSDVQDIIFEVNDTQEDVNENVELDASESISGTFTYETEEGDAPELTVEVASENETASETVTVNEPAFLRVDIIETNSPIVHGDTLTVDAEIQNIGDVEATQEIELEIEGEGVVDTEEVTLDGGEDRTLILRWETELGDVDEYEATVSSEDDEDTVNVTVQGGPPDPGPPGPGPWMLTLARW